MPAPKRKPVVPYDQYPHLRTQLRILRENYPHFSGRDRLDVFNELNQPILAAANFENGKLASFDKLDSQWRESRNEKNEEKWARILVDPLDMTEEEHRVYVRTYEMIKLAAARLGKEPASVPYYEDDKEEDSELEEEDGDVELLRKIEEEAKTKAEKNRSKALGTSTKPALEVQDGNKKTKVSIASLSKGVQELRKEMEG